MTTSRFDPHDPRLTAYVLGELGESDVSEDERQEIERQLEQCLESRTAVDEVRKLAKRLTAELQHESAPTLSDDQHTAIEAEAKRAAVATTRVARRKKRFAVFAALSSAAATVAVVIWLQTPPDLGENLMPVSGKIKLRGSFANAIADNDANTPVAETDSLKPTLMGRNHAISRRLPPLQTGKPLTAQHRVKLNDMPQPTAAPKSSSMQVVNQNKSSPGAKIGGGLMVGRRGLAPVPTESNRGATLPSAFYLRDDAQFLQGDIMSLPAVASGDGEAAVRISRSSVSPSKPTVRFGTTVILDSPSAPKARGAGRRGKQSSNQRLTEIDWFQLTERRPKWKVVASPPPGDSKDVKGQNRAKNFGVTGFEGIVGSVVNSGNSEVIVDGFDGERKRTPAAEITSEEFGRLKSEFARSEGRQANEQYNVIIENDFLSPTAAPLSTFSIDVDTASYANVRRFLNGGRLPPPDAVRIEELVNYFRYDDPSPEGPQPFSVNLEVAACPWNAAHRLVRIGLKGKDFDRGQRPPTNLVFLVDVSGSMRDANKLPLVRRSLNMLVNEMGEDDRIAIVTYASNAGLLLDSTSGEHKDKIRKAINSLNANGSTNGEAGIQLAYQTAKRHFYPQGSNRVILCTDGDLNVGVSSDEALVRMIQDKASKSRVFLSIFGFGMSNLKDAKLEQLADKGNGHYGYIDGQREARKVFVEELTGTLFTIAKDVKIQIEFNPAQVGAYRLIGYENRVMAARDFDDDSKDAGEIGAGHTVIALYEIIPPDKLPQPRKAVALKYQQLQQKQPEPEKKADESGELLTLYLRYKQPDGERSTRLEYPLNDKQALSARASRDFDWTAAVAGFGMILRNSQYKGQADFDLVLELAAGSKGTDKLGRRQEFIDLVKKAKTLRGR